MTRAPRIAALGATLLLALGLSVSAQGKTPALTSVSFEASSLAYGLAVGSPRISVSTELELSGRWSIQASPLAAWGGDAGAGYLELDLPLALRASFRLGPFEPYGAAGIEVGWARWAGANDAFAAGPLAEAGARLRVFRARLYLEPYLGAAGMAVFGGDSGASFLPSLYGGLRLGYAF